MLDDREFKYIIYLLFIVIGICIAGDLIFLVLRSLKYII